MFMAIKERSSLNSRRPAKKRLAWYSKPTEKKRLTLSETIRTIQENFRKKRIARMRPEERELFSGLENAKKRLEGTQTNLKKLKELHQKEITGWRRKRQTKGSDFTEADAQLETQELKKWANYVEKYKDALPQLQEDYNTALNLWKGRKLLRKA